MKTSLFLTAAFAVALMSCSKNETLEMNNGKGITFRAFTDPSTRAADVITSNIGGFHLYALQEGSTTGVANSTLAWQDDYTVSDGTATGKTPHYWPGDGSSLYFFAYNSGAIDSPATTVVNGTVSISGTEQKIKDVKPNKAAADQKDLVVSYQTGNNKTPGANAVQMNFIHAFSKVTVSAKNETSGLTVKVLGVRIYGVNNKATLTLPVEVTNDATKLTTSNWAPNANTGNGSMSTSENKYTSHGELNDDSGAVTLESGAKSIMQSGDNAFMLLPQALTAWNKDNTVSGAYIAVLCQATQSNGNGGQYQLFPETQGKYGWTAVPIDQTWEPGKAYNYILNFSNGGGTVPPKDDEDDGKDPVDDNTNPGDNAWGSAINISVTVTDWGSANNVNKDMQ